VEEGFENVIHAENDGSHCLEVEIDLIFGVGLVFDFLRYAKDDLVDDLGKEDPNAPEEDGWEIGA
jgi:hypothetical protein